MIDRGFTVFAISDLHLSFARPKPMDVFGDHWIDHPEKIADSWQKQVKDDDIVVISGDISWAMKIDGAMPDLEFIHSLPGRKVIIRGNHDFWYPKSGAKRSRLPSSIKGLYRSSEVIDGVAFIGCKGLSLEPEDMADEKTFSKNLHRSVGNLKASLAHLRDSGKEYSELIALIHYPPFPPGKSSGPFSQLLSEAQVSKCVFGHLHCQEDFSRVVTGSIDSVKYYLASADYLNFKLLAL